MERITHNGHGAFASRAFLKPLKVSQFFVSCFWWARNEPGFRRLVCVRPKWRYQ